VSEPAERLTVDLPPGPVSAVAVVLHGGRANSTTPVSARQLTVLRMVPFAAALRAAGAAHGLAVARVRYRVRGWNGSPVDDVRSALDELGRRFGAADIALIGHSMGGRTAIYVADDERVRAVVGLAPWVEKDDPVATLAGRRVLLAHGTRDRMTSAVATARYADKARAVAATTSYVSVEGDGHAMLRRAALWHRLAAQFSVGALFGTADGGTGHGDTTNVVWKALAGEPSLVV
jgi:pimeloyl-ACP methyl ester carboxylesterase